MRLVTTRGFFTLLVAGIVALLPVRAYGQPPGGVWGKLRGIVTDEQGNPIAGAAVLLERPSGGYTGNERPHAFSDSGGRYIFDWTKDRALQPKQRFARPGEKLGPDVLAPGPEPGEYALEASKAGYEPYRSVVNIAADTDTVHNIVLKKKAARGITLIFNGGVTFLTFPDAEDDVCTKVLNDFGAAGYNEFSCKGDRFSRGWFTSATLEKGISDGFGVFGTAGYRQLGGPQLAYEGRRTLNQLFFHGGGTYDLRIVQAAVGPSFSVTDTITIYPSVNFDWWKSDFDIKNQLQSAGQVVNNSNASGNESGFAVNFGAAVDWHPGGRPIGVRVEAQRRNFDDVVTTSVTGLPKNDSGFTFGLGIVYKVFSTGRRTP